MQTTGPNATMGATLHALRQGVGAPVLLLHGIGSSATSWEPQFAQLGGAYRLIAPDLRGYGDSPDPVEPAALESVVADVAALLEGEPAAHVVGVSFGALVALALARTRPGLVRSLVLADATLGRGHLPEPEREAWRAGRYRLAADLPAAARSRAGEIAARGAGESVLEAIASAMRRARASGYRYVADVIARTDAAAWLPEIGVPTLVLCGAEDRVTGAAVSARIAQAVPGAFLAAIPDAGHAPHVERPAEFAAAVRAFFASVEAPSRVLRVAIAGGGAIAHTIADGIARGDAGTARTVAFGVRPQRAGAIAARAAELSAEVVTDLANLSRHAPLVVEAASQDAVRAYAPAWLRGGADVMVLSAGALVDRAFREELLSVAAAAGRRVYVPSGAIAGVDGIRAAALGGLRSLRLRTTKPPRGLAGAPYVVQHGIDLDALAERTVVFRGAVEDAVRAFPSNVNVAAIAALAGEAPAAAFEVVVVADPHAATNVHELEAEGDFGAFSVRLENRPSPANPKTSALAPLSALAMLRRLTTPLWVGA